MEEFTKTKYTTPGSHNLRILSRSEFHCTHQNVLTIADFDTSHSNGQQINEISASLRRTLVGYADQQRNKENRA